MDLGLLWPHPYYLAAAVVLDLLLGDPQYRLHPIRLIGASVSWMERVLRSAGLNGLAGGTLLGIACAVFWTGIAAVLLAGASAIHPLAAAGVHVFIVYSLLALRNLLDHAWAVESAARAGDLQRARNATSMFVARDTDAMDLAACRRASIESLSENLADGYTSPLFWYTVAGLPGLVVFKVFSTLDSMVGYRNERYILFGRFSARADDALNWIPARVTWLLIALCAVFIKGCSASGALRIGWRQHALAPGPNSGWSEAGAAGALRLRLVGPITLRGRRVTELWLGDSHVPEAGTSASDVPRAMALMTAVGLAGAVLSVGILLVVR